mmetsp:Transcript_29391/g.80333  ORF Transcript_29391/g.80333 Transcript_29391/m.80333 type:complete len:423 (-) Transcript_29391:212-1480(-)
MRRNFGLPMTSDAAAEGLPGKRRYILAIGVALVGAALYGIVAHWPGGLWASVSLSSLVLAAFAWLRTDTGGTLVATTSTTRRFAIEANGTSIHPLTKAWSPSEDESRKARLEAGGWSDLPAQLEKAKAEAKSASASAEAARSRIATLEQQLVEQRCEVASARKEQRRHAAELEDERQRSSVIREQLGQLARREDRPRLGIHDLIQHACTGNWASERRAVRAEARADLLQDEVRRLTAENQRSAVATEGALQEASARAAEAGSAASALAAAQCQVDEFRQREQQTTKLYESAQKEAEKASHQKAKLVAQLKEAQREYDALYENFEAQQEKLQNEIARTKILEEELRAQSAMRVPSMPVRMISPWAARSEFGAVDTVGELLKRSITNAPPERRDQVKKQLLLCFHPDRNPNVEVANRITQILNS